MIIVRTFLMATVFVGLAGCTVAPLIPAREASPGVPGETAVRVNPLSPLIRKGAFYEGPYGTRYKFTDGGATYETVVPAPGPYAVSVGDTSGWMGTRVVFKDSSGGCFYVDGNFAGDDFVLFESQPVDQLNQVGVETRLDSDGRIHADAEAVKSARTAMTGELLEILNSAAVECTESTVSISWSEGDPTLFEATGCDATAERMRIEDDGLRLVSIKNDSIQYILK